VQIAPPDFDGMFGALADRPRRDIVRRAIAAEEGIVELASHYSMSFAGGPEAHRHPRRTKHPALDPEASRCDHVKQPTEDELSEKETAPMKLATTAQVSVDEVMQGPGGPEEDERGRFERGGSQATPSGVTIHVYRPTGRPQYAT
jgi:hypothetical protein